MEDAKRRITELEHEVHTLRLILTGDLQTVGLIESVRSLTSIVGEMKTKQDGIADDIAAIRAAEQTRMNIRLGEQKAAKRLRTFFYIVGSIILGGTGSLLGYLGKLLVTVGTPPG